MAFAIFFLATYKIVGANEVHVIVFMGRGRKVYGSIKSGDGQQYKTSYFYVPFLMKRYIMPTTNVKLNVDDIKLKDSLVAPFVCDVITWLHIADPVKASERLDFSSDDDFVQNVFRSLHQDLIAIVQAVARTSAMKQEILEIMRDRETFAKTVSQEVNGVLESWGVKLVNLEVNDIRDDNGSHVIQNYEQMRKAQVESTARKEVAIRDREAVETEQENRRQAEVAKADSERVFGIAQQQRDRDIGIAEQGKEQDIAVAEQLANETRVAALRTLEVGQADVKRQATVTTAQGEADAIKIKGEREAEVITLTGTAEGNAIKSKGVAEAEAKDRMAEALKKFNEAGIDVTKIQANVDIQKAFAAAYAKIAENAEIKIVNGGDGGNLFGIPLDGKTGAGIGQMLEALGSEKIAKLVEGITSKKA